MAIAAAVVKNATSRRASGDDRRERDLAARNREAGTTNGNRARSGVAFSVWTIFALAGAFLLVAIVKTGQVAEGVFLAVLVFVLIGAILPPVGIVVGLIVLTAILLRGGGVALFTWLGGLAGKQFGPSQPYAPIAPTLPGYAPPDTTGLPYAPLGPSAAIPKG